jgi:hypothetical protein
MNDIPSSDFRLLFGSVIGTIGKTDGGSYIIKEILLQEQKPSGVIDSSWLKRFIDLDLTNLNDIPTIIYLPLISKKLRATKSSPNSLEAHRSDDDDNKNDDDDDDDNKIDDEDDEPLLTTTK